MPAIPVVDMVGDFFVSIDAESGPFESVEPLRLGSGQHARTKAAELSAYNKRGGPEDLIGYRGGDLGVV
jgi:hypothetical protein